MEDITKEYTNGEVTVVWKPTVSKHSAIYFRSLPTVFDPRRRSWVKTEDSTTEKIVYQMKKCPSVALSY